MQTKDYKEPRYDSLPETAQTVILAMSVLLDRIRTLPKPDRDDLYELFQGMAQTDDAEEMANIRRAIEEILAQSPVEVIPMPMPMRDTTMPPRLKSWAEHVGKKIKELRKDAGLTQAQLAEKAGLPQSHISRLENAEHSATNLTLAKIAAALGVDVGKLDPCSD